MNLRLLGLCAIIGAPFLLGAFIAFDSDVIKQRSALDGLFSLLYISGWMCSVVGLWKTGAAGTNRWGRIVLGIQLLFLTLANVSNVMLLLQIGVKTPYYFVLDLFWPISNLWMLATGITILVAKRLQGWMRFVPLVVGLWLPLCLVLLGGLFGFTPTINLIGGFYSAVAWTLLGVVVYRMDTRTALLAPQLA
jgi:hypothetical protein